MLETQITQIDTQNNQRKFYSSLKLKHRLAKYEGWNFNSGNYLFTTDKK